MATGLITKYADDTSSSTLVTGTRDTEADVLPDLIKITAVIGSELAKSV